MSCDPVNLSRQLDYQMIEKESSKSKERKLRSEERRVGKEC